MDSDRRPALRPRPAAPWRLGGLTLRELAVRVWKKTGDDELFDRAAGLSYYFLFALFPTLLFLTALLGLLPIENLADELMAYARRVLPADAASLLVRTLGEVMEGASKGLLSIGILAALWGASTGMASIIRALNVACNCRHEARPRWRRRLVALALTLGLSVFTLAALLLLGFGARIGEGLAHWLGLGGVFTTIWNVARWPALLACILTGITLVYRDRRGRAKRCSGAGACENGSGTPACRPSVSAARERREQGDDVAVTEWPIGGSVSTVDEDDAFEIHRDAQALHELARRHSIRHVDDRRSVAASGRQVGGEGREESDLDLHRNPP